MDRNFIHSFHSLSCDRSIATSKSEFFHRVRTNAFSFNFQYPFVSSWTYISYLRLLLVLLSLPNICPATTCFRRSFLCNVTKPVSLPSFHCIQDIPVNIYQFLDKIFLIHSTIYIPALISLLLGHCVTTLPQVGCWLY